MPSREIKPRTLLQALLKAGFEIKRQRGSSHVFLERIRNSETRRTSISLHTKPLPFGTLRAILKQTGISEDELKDLL